MDQKTLHFSGFALSSCVAVAAMAHDGFDDAFHSAQARRARSACAAATVGPLANVGCCLPDGQDQVQRLPAPAGAAGYTCTAWQHWRANASRREMVVTAPRPGRLAAPLCCRSRRRRAWAGQSRQRSTRGSWIVDFPCPEDDRKTAWMGLKLAFFPRWPKAPKDMNDMNEHKFVTHLNC